MSNVTSSIDDILSVAHLPPAERQKAVDSHVTNNDDSSVDGVIEVTDDNNYVQKPEKVENKPEIKQKPVEIESKSEKNEELESAYDDYGNEKPKPSSKTYTEEEVNERINRAVRERFERFERKNNQQQPVQPVQPQNQPYQAPQQPNGTNNGQDGDWQKELKEFIKNTQLEAQREETERYYKQQEEKAEQEFTQKFIAGSQKFNDFREVVDAQPISQPMVLAMRAINDPASFIYAASKRNPQELERISKIPDAYTQMVEIGRLEEKMRRNQPNVTKAARPLSMISEDVVQQEPKKAPKFDDILQMSDSQRLSNLSNRRARR